MKVENSLNAPQLDEPSPRRLRVSTAPALVLACVAGIVIFVFPVAGFVAVSLALAVLAGRFAARPPLN